MKKLQGLLAAATFLTLSGSLLKGAEIANANLGQLQSRETTSSQINLKLAPNVPPSLSRVSLRCSQNNSSLSTDANKNFSKATFTILAQGYGGRQDSSWGQVDEPPTYTNPETGQTFCFYSRSGRWAPCPGQGTTAIIPRNATCRGGTSSGEFWQGCPRAVCEMDGTYFPQPGEPPRPSLPCYGLP